MLDYDLTLKWSELGRPTEATDLDIVALSGYVFIEEADLKEVRRLGVDNPRVFLKADVDTEDEDSDEPIMRSFSIVGFGVE